MARKREKSFVLSFWNYNNMQTGGISQVDMWQDLCMNVVMMPSHYKDDAELEAELPKLMDELHRRGMKILLKFEDTDPMYGIQYGKDKLEEAFLKKYEQYGKHPAVIGFYPGEEPSEWWIDFYAYYVKYIHETAPELSSFIVLGNDKYMDMIGRTGVPVLGFDNYSQMEPEIGGTQEHFRLLCQQDKVAKKYGADFWVTLLASGHYRFQSPTEVDYIWQINTAAASGATGIFWFRMYDRLALADYRGAPIDEYAQPNGEYYRGLKRAQKRFTIHHAEILMRLFHQKAFHITKHYGGYEGFPADGYCGVKRAYSSNTFFGYYDIDPIPGIVSFFKDENGCDYIAIVNNTKDTPGSITLDFDKKVKKVLHVYYNGDMLNDIPLKDENNIGYYSHETWLAPGQMELYKIEY